MTGDRGPVLRPSELREGSGRCGVGLSEGKAVRLGPARLPIVGDHEPDLGRVRGRGSTLESPDGDVEVVESGESGPEATDHAPVDLPGRWGE